MTCVVLTLNTEADTRHFAARLAACLYPPLVLAFSGQLGAGKTALIRAMFQALGVTGAIKSPTFSLLETYAIPASSSVIPTQAGIHLNHFDLYRIEDSEALEVMGFRDYFNNQSICCIEWPERVEPGYFPIDLACSLRILPNDARVLTIESLSHLGETCLSQVEHHVA